MVSHLFLDCEKTRILWNLMFNLFDISRVLAEIVQKQFGLLEMYNYKEGEKKN